MQDCVEKMHEIEQKQQDKYLRHELTLHEVSMEVKDKNMRWQEKKNKIKQDHERKDIQKKESLERSIDETNQRLAKKG